MELSLAIIGALFIAGLVAAVFGTLHYLANNPESEMERHRLLAQR